MKLEKVMYFTRKEDEFVNTLVAIGTRRSVAKVLIFLANIPEASSRDIERGADLRLSEVSIALRYLGERSWISYRESKPEKKGCRSKYTGCPNHSMKLSIVSKKRKGRRQPISSPLFRNYRTISMMSERSCISPCHAPAPCQFLLFHQVR
jgi:predicted transcriptional regulator